MSLVKIGETYMINKEETMEHINKVWAQAKAHPKISIAVAVVIVLIIISI
jgi:hypothetical protein